MKRLAAYLVSAARSLRAMQLTSGELPSVHWSASGEAFYAPSPLLSALAHDALSFVDPRSPMFVPRVRDLVSSSFFSDVITLRWGLRLFLASEQNSDGTWQRHGRLGNGDPDVATTACAAAALLPNVKWRRAAIDRRHLVALQKMQLREWSTLEAAHALRYLAMIGADVRPLLARVRADLERTPDVAALHAIGGALRSQLAYGESSSREVESTSGSSLAAALHLATMLDGNEANDALDGAIERLLLDPTPPWRWPADPYGGHRVGSPAVALAIQIANVARRSALPPGERS